MIVNTYNLEKSLYMLTARC